MRRILDTAARYVAASLLLVSLGWTDPSMAQTVTTVFNFNTVWNSVGGAPNASLIQGSDGYLYGTTSTGSDASGATAAEGAVFKVSVGGSLDLIHAFCSTGCPDGQLSTAGLVLASDGNYYGTTTAGGANNAGTIFKVSAQGTFTSIYSFCNQQNANYYCIDGSGPGAALVEGPDGSLYGTSGGGSNNGGTIFKITTAGVLTTLYNFCSNTCATGEYPAGPLLLASDGNFYGTTTAKGAYGTVHYGGTIFKMTPQGSVTALYSFCASSSCPDGLDPGGLIQGADGRLYGTAASGGAQGDGNMFAFKLGSGTEAGTFVTLYNFCSLSGCKDGGHPSPALVQTSDGSIYGTTAVGGAGASHYGGTIFKITAGTLSTVYNFCAGTNWNSTSDYCIDGAKPNSLLVANKGVLYGTTASGGGSANAGLVFTLGQFTRDAAVGRETDYLGEGKSGFTVWRPSTGYWYSIDGNGKSLSSAWGASTDLPVIGDFDGDGKSDLAVFRPSTGYWYIQQSSNSAVVAKQFGASTDQPVAGDFDGDGKTDITVFRPSTGYWYTVQSSNGAVVAKQFGESTDTPVVGDFDGDGKSDIAVFRPSTGYWYITQSSNGSVVAKQFGASTDMPVTGDFDGDGKTDLAVYRPSTGYWYIVQSSNGGVVAKQWGASGDVPVARDYDGDGKTDIAVWRPSTGYWYVVESSSGQTRAVQWGASTDVPVNNLQR